MEHLASLRAMPNLCIIRPADANEVAYAWRVAMKRRHGPTMLVLTRQGLPILDRRKMASAEGLLRGAYVLTKEKGASPAIVLMASGSEVQLILRAQEALALDNIDARVVSMPSWELFLEQTQGYRDEVLLPDVDSRLAVEVGVEQGWRNWVGDKGDIIGITKFGASAPNKVILNHYGFTVENIVERAKRLLGK